MKIVVLDGYSVVQDDMNWEAFRKYGELECYERTAKDQIISRIKDADAVITSKCIFDKEVIDSAGKLRYIGVIATGYNNIDIDYARSKGITITNIPAYSTDSVAQLTFSLLLEIVNRVGLHNESVHSGDWEKSIDFCYTLSRQTELAGKTFGIIGYGNIGKKVAALASAFGMNVLVYSSHTEKTGGGKTNFVDLHELLSASDIVSLHCALTDKNKEMINKESLALMKDDAILINTSRGPLINEADLAEALNNGRLRAAALDVMTQEPPKNGSPLIKIENCIITPHIAWDTEEARRRLIDIADKNLGAYMCGKALNSVT